MALFRYFSGVRLIKVSFKVNKGNKFGDFGDCPLNTGFTVFCIFSTSSSKRLVFLVSWSFLQRHLWLWLRKRWRRILDWPWEKWKSFKSLLWHDQSRWWVLVFYSYHWKELHPQIRLQDGWPGARSSRPWEKEGARSPKKLFFGPSGLSFVKSNGGGRGGRSRVPRAPPLDPPLHCY